MHYIVYDLEFNQYFTSMNSDIEKKSSCPFEIIQIGALKLDVNFNTVATFNRYVKSTIYPEINPFITNLTGITTDQLLSEASFPEVFKDYVEFIGEGNAVFCVWGMTDIKELYRNVEYYKLDKTCLSDMFIDIQSYVSIQFNFSKSKLLGLQTAVELLNILMPYDFHDAFYDAYYTAEIFKNTDSSAIQAKRYDPNYVPIRARLSLQKKTVDYRKLIQQFEKMHARELNKEEQDMVILAYKMGKTHQFIK